MKLENCLCCGAHELILTPVLWQALTDEWRLAPYEVEYVNRQQGLHCAVCSANLRSMALALAIMRTYSYRGVFADFIESAVAQRLTVLEINEAGNLTPYLKMLPNHALGSYPAVDMQQLPFSNDTYDLVVHSDTLEHVAHPVRGLAECRRVLRPGGACAFTVPMIVDRLTHDRAGLPPSYHGAASVDRDDYVVHTEYGSDAWRHVFLAGFSECRLFSLEFPAAQAFIALND